MTNQKNNDQKIKLYDAILKYETEKHTDVVFFNGAINFSNEVQLQDLLKQTDRPNLFLILITGGGDPDAAYRIARSIQQKANNFTICITGLCKSAGTLIALGADQLVMTNTGELGPLDVQIKKTDEIWEMSSGLNVMTSLQTIQSKALMAFTECIIKIKIDTDGAVTLKTAVEAANHLVGGLYGNIFKQIDPIQIGEIGRSMNIAKKYGESLSRKPNNLKSDTLTRLISFYPSHSYVIDKQECENLFNHVNDPSELEQEILDGLVAIYGTEVLRLPLNSPVIAFLRDLFKKEPQQDKADKNDEHEKNSELKVVN